jgi:hypothetical protein
MSTFLSQARARTLRPGVGLPRPRLTIVPKVAARAPRIPFTVLVVAVLAGGLVGLLLLNTALQRGAYTVTGLQQQSDQLGLQEQNLTTGVAALEAPQRIGERALRLGMVADDSPSFLSLKTGRVIGVPVAGSRAHRPTLGAAGTGSSPSPTLPAAPGLVPTTTSGSGAKLVSLVAGEAASQGTGPIVVAKVHSDTHGTSGHSGTAQGTKNINHTR